MAVCYRHPNRETGVSCSNCGRPICPDCMTTTPVGMRCPECSRQRTPVRTMRNVRSEPRVTVAIIALCVLAFLATGSFGPGGGGGDALFRKLALFGPDVSAGEYWRLVTSGFLHAGILHIAFNMYILWILGNILEPAIGTGRFVAIYFVSLLGGAFGALLLSDPRSATVGASGAVFGLMGAAFFELRHRGIDPFQAGIGGLIVFNLLLSVIVPGISIGGHLGGLFAGALCALALQFGDRRRSQLIGFGICALLAVAATAGAIATAASKTSSLIG